ncbi:MAG: dimethylmenaquinone methyltransferase [Stappiaceae bacterium]
MTITINQTPALNAPEADLARWRTVPVAVAVDLSSDIRQIDAAIRPVRPAGTQPLLFGRAVTARCEPPDFGAVLNALDLIEPGDVLVIAAHGFAGNAMIGDVLCGHLRSKGCVGVICDGPIRDVATMAGWSDFPVYCRSINPKGPEGAKLGAVNEPVSFGKCQILPGDLIIGDDDGLVALSAADLKKWIKPAEAKLALEEKWKAGLASGETAKTIFAL